MGSLNALAGTYHKLAGQFLKSHYKQNDENSILFRFHFFGELAGRAKVIAKSVHLQGMDYQNAIVATWFSYAGPAEIIMPSADSKINLLHQFFNAVQYPGNHQAIVEDAVKIINDSSKNAETLVQQVVSDAVYSLFGAPHLLENIALLKDEVNRVFLLNKTELFYLQYFYDLSLKIKYHTGYACTNYAEEYKKNAHAIEKRIKKLEDLQQIIATGSEKSNGASLISNRETEDLFKLALRNYNHLISVADSKASLLIHVNAIIISVMLAFVVRQLDKFDFLQVPALLLLFVSLVTIFLSILASRPQHSNSIEKNRYRQAQCFFFGSFDLIDSGFRHVSWEDYRQQAASLFNSTKETVHMELYKESFDVRKVLSKKFSFLSMAYWVFIIGLLLSVTAFAIAIRFQKPI